jgi:hypothetical protein
MTAQDLGNHHFGVVGKAYGLFPEETMLREAGAAQMTAGTSKPEWQQYEERQVTGERGTTGTVKVMMPPYGDDPRDQEMIKEGFKYYEETKNDDDN